MKKYVIAVMVIVPISLFASGSCSLDDVFVAKDCYKKVLTADHESTSTSPAKATEAQAKATLQCLAKVSPNCASCSKAVFQQNDYNMQASEPGIRNQCLTLW